MTKIVSVTIQRSTL